MARGKPFAVISTQDRTLDDIQRRLWDVLDQVEDTRRGMLVSTVLSAPASTSLSEQLVVIYTGKGGDIFRLPPANLRGSGRSQILLIANQGQGTVTIVPVGNDTLNGVAAVTTNGTVLLWSDGAAKWHEASAYSLPAVGPGAGTIGSGITSITLDAQGRVTAIAAGNMGTATLNFGAFPGASDTSVAVTGQAGIVAGSIVEAWVRPAVTADHSEDEHLLETLKVAAMTIVAGTGFTIKGVGDSMLYGQFSVGWRWN